MKKQHEVTVQNIQSAILTLPGRPPFMVTKQLADLYETDSERVLQAYRRNLKKFPEDFVFQLTEEEAKTLQSEGSMTYLGGALPYGFSRNGFNMLSAVLQGDVADERAIQIMRAFSAFEEMFQVNQEGRPALYTMVKTVDHHHLLKYYHEGRGKMCAIPVSDEDSAGMKQDILAGMTTAQVAKKYDRSKSTVKKHTKVERARIVLENSGQMTLPFAGGHA
ncbi:ORF6N domain-containing protein [Desulfocapsa sp. AH-315-G09]|uniref:ORF6N domain-containing protein n=1 Tax=Desulfotalea psychrophila TaxID=84980 RepID=A0ABS3AZW0_9BACT|nr:ORF6N domain-containing protein [Desulfocapsa sp.]MBN4065281.1 ORF6N domain-containing protein [Desulfocapsa sp. AH-315-G09]MBN4068860.1 ORF6N domain-containing protein [Desulfotalea psychrophila]